MKKYSDKNKKELIKAMRTQTCASSDVVRKVKEIIYDVEARGDKAILDWTYKLDAVELTPKKPSACPYQVEEEKIKSAIKKIPKLVLDSLKMSADRIRKYHEHQKESSWQIYEDNGTILGQIVLPLERVAVYAPGGKAAYPSTVLMNVIPAQVAGCKEIILFTPPKRENNAYPNDIVLAAADIVGIKTIYRIGGAQAVAGFAIGTESLIPVDMICGPGNAYVTEAKRQVYGKVKIDSLAGPSEIVVIADDSADPRFIAADMLSQLEHSEDAMAAILSSSSKIIKQTELEVKKQFLQRKRQDILKVSIETGAFFVRTESLASAFEIANEIAPEHLELQVAEPMLALAHIKNAGAIFLGSYSSEVLGDYAAGPNHVLPTGGTARFSSPLSVYDFVKRSSLIFCSKQGAIELSESAAVIADNEGLDAHSAAARIRLNKTIKR